MTALRGQLYFLSYALPTGIASADSKVPLPRRERVGVRVRVRVSEKGVASVFPWAC
jgi:hypothetical protein